MGETEEIKIEEEEVAESTDEAKEKISTEEFKVKGEELVEAVGKLVHEAGVRRIIIKYKDGRTLFEIPLVLGLAGIALLPMWSALALVAALVTECSILVERVEKEPEATEEADAPEESEVAE
jgi:hypothetical protein